MLQAQTGRQLNLAAKTIRAFLAEKQVELKHNDALELVGRLAGFPNYQSAVAALDGQRKGTPSKVGTWLQLAHALGTLDENQLDMSIAVSEGCDENGNAEFFPAGEFVLAGDRTLQAATDGVLEPKQPILLFQTSHADELVHFDADRISMQFEAAAGEPAVIALREIKEHGMSSAISRLNERYDLQLSLGRFVAFSRAENGFWNSGFGWVYDKASATGYDELPLLAGVPDLQLIRYEDAVDVDPDAEDSPFTDDLVAGINALLGTPSPLGKKDQSKLLDSLRAVLKNYGYQIIKVLSTAPQYTWYAPTGELAIHRYDSEEEALRGAFAHSQSAEATKALAFKTE